MNKRKLVHVAYGYDGYARWILPLGYELTKDYTKADLLLLAGGEDIDAGIYRENRGSYTGRPGKRDEIEVALYNYFNERKKPIAGICRGAQNLCALKPGGSLVQHSQHPHYHSIVTDDGKQMGCISMHHQQLRLDNVDPKEYKLMAWAEKLSPFHLDGNDQDYNYGPDYKEPEVVLFSGNQLAVQSHPECMDFDSPFVNYCKEIFMAHLH